MDEPLKAYYLLKELDIPELKEDLDKTYGMVRHLFEPELYKKIYANDSCLSYEKIEPESKALHAEMIYPRYAWVLEEMEKERSKSLIDLACYVGSLVLTAADRGIKATGVDMTAKAIKVAQERAKRLSVDAKFVCSDLMDYKGKADTVVAFEVIEHVPDPELFIKHLLSLVNKGGWCYISTPDGPYGNGAGNLGHWEYDGEHTRGHVRVFTHKTLEGLIKSCGCETTIGIDGGLLFAKFRKGVK